MFHRQRQVPEMPLDATPTQEMNQPVSGPRVINSVTGGKGQSISGGSPGHPQEGKFSHRDRDVVLPETSS